MTRRAPETPAFTLGFSSEQERTMNCECKVTECEFTFDGEMGAHKIEFCHLHASAEKLRDALDWCMDELPAGIDWGGPFDEEHKQGEYHCTHCDARWKPTGAGLDAHKADCPLLKCRAALSTAKGKP